MSGTTGTPHTIPNRGAKRTKGTIKSERYDRFSIVDYPGAPGRGRTGIRTPDKCWFVGASDWAKTVPHLSARKRMTSRHYIYVSENDNEMSFETPRGRIAGFPQPFLNGGLLVCVTRT